MVIPCDLFYSRVRSTVILHSGKIDSKLSIFTRKFSSSVHPRPCIPPQLPLLKAVDRHNLTRPRLSNLPRPGNNAIITVWPGPSPRKLRAADAQGFAHGKHLKAITIVRSKPPQRPSPPSNLPNLLLVPAPSHTPYSTQTATRPPRPLSHHWTSLLLLAPSALQSLS